MVTYEYQWNTVHARPDSIRSLGSGELEDDQPDIRPGHQLDAVVRLYLQAGFSYVVARLRRRPDYHKRFWRRRKLLDREFSSGLVLDERRI
jgi:hypothetical protein